MSMIWINFLHAYQPPWQNKEILDKVVNECYRNLIRIARKNNNLFFTLNISGCLTELLEQNGYKDVIKDFADLSHKGQIEFVGSAMYHPILPLVSLDDAKRQILENREINKRVFKGVYNPTGFYFPEMAVNSSVLDLVSKLGFKWVILDEKTFDGKVDYRISYEIPNGLKVIFRDRNISNKYIPDYLYNLLKENKFNQFDDDIIVTATDAELYGHHHIDYSANFENILKDKRLKTQTCSSFLSTRISQKRINLKPGSWETKEKDFVNNIPFPLWDNPENDLQRKIWKLVEEGRRVLEKNKDDQNFFWARKHFDRGIASCTFWWCSRKKPSPFCSVTWNPEEIEKGVLEIVKSIRSLDFLDNKIKQEFEEKYFDLKKYIWKEHWQKKDNTN